MKNLSLTLLCWALLCTCVSAQSLYFADHPALSPDGETLVFSYNGDLWKVPSAGGAANRITALDGAESHPRISPDGKWLAFTSGQYGNADVYVTPLAGGEITQLTYHQAADQVANWSWDSKTIYFTSSRYNRMATFTVPVTGGTPKRLMPHYFNIAHNVVPLPGSDDFLFNETWESSNFTHRKGYKGPYNPDLKRYDPKVNKVTQLTKWEGKDMWPMADRKGNIFFVSDRDNGEYNLYSLNSDGKIKRLTKYATSVFSPSLSADGSKIAYVRDYQLEVYDVASGRSKVVPVSLNSFVGLAKTADFKTGGNLDYFDVARDGKKLAAVSRGELFVSDMEGEFVRQIMTGPGRVMEVKWLKDGKTLVFTQTYNGYQNLYTVSADGTGEPTRRTSDTRNNRNLEMSHDTSRVAYLSGRDEVRVMDLDDFSAETVAKQEVWFRGSIPRWSPDDRYLMFTGYLDFEEDIFLVDTENGNELMNLTQTGVTETDPVWSPDGKYIYFSSSPHVPSYPRGGGNVDLWRLPLYKFDEPHRSDKFDQLFAEEDKKKGKKDSVVVRIEAEGIMERIERVGPSFGSQSGAFVVEDDDKTIVFYGSNHEGSRALYMTTYEPFESPKTMMFKGRGVGNATDLVEVKGKYYLLGSGNVQKLNVGQKKFDAIEVKHTFRRALGPEFEQMFYETWANMEENFYDENFHGVDWQGMRDRYAAFLPYITNRADLRRLTNDLLGELNTSHFGFSSRGKEESTKQGARSLALGLAYDQNDPYRIASIITDGPADRNDVDLMAGDRITAIDGIPVEQTVNRESYLSRPSIDGSVSLTVERNGQVVSTSLHPTSYTSERTNRYDEWVDTNQRTVDEKTDKKIAYVHMKNMTGGQLDAFMSEMVSEGHQRQGLILDLRYNTGGNVHDAVLNFLSQRPYLKWQYRAGQRANQPNFAPAGQPIILMINEQSLSDAEMTAAGFKELGLGTIVGTPTYRWIIFTSGKGLVDGSFYRLPSWGTYTLDGKNLEKTGVEPDVRIDNTAADRATGKDPQLMKAIELALKGLDR
ncbi:PDZ domain-containing protein [Neolewinella aurantiaca]|uniref:Tricorn protease homolog n=1 Tax=Neolewinella aurantiaca TaxID=2602767 RepID=A0A5C7G138_9BACT|nr:S41 family peptidase [Neolewinella aurantiaca]TXF91499.1 PDZ domain-containing protein [Neolewinella aurantiaca]